MRILVDLDNVLVDFQSKLISTWASYETGTDYDFLNSRHFKLNMIVEPKHRPLIEKMLNTEGFFCRYDAATRRS